jgi:predicted flap endonuclease-1-like 5' DNA nuclease
MTDANTYLIIAGVVLALALLLWLLLRPRRQRVIEREERPAEPYVARTDRPYVDPPPADIVAPLVTPAPAEQVDVAQPAVPLPGDLAGIAFPPGATDHTDELTRLKGVGPKLEAMLNDLGVTRFEQLASMSEEDLAALDARLGAFAGRLQRDRVAEQARYLASGDTAGFEATFGKLG